MANKDRLHLKAKKKAVDTTTVAGHDVKNDAKVAGGKAVDNGNAGAHRAARMRRVAGIRRRPKNDRSGSKSSDTPRASRSFFLRRTIPQDTRLGTPLYGRRDASPAGCIARV